MSYRMATLLVATAGETSRGEMHINSRLTITELALEWVVREDTHPAVPLWLDHDPERQVGMVERWGLERHLGRQSLIAEVRVTDLSCKVEEGMPVSLGAGMRWHPGRDGDLRVTELRPEEVSLLTGGAEAAFRSSMVLSVGAVLGAVAPVGPTHTEGHVPTSSTLVATEWKGMGAGRYTIVGPGEPTFVRAPGGA